MVTIEELKRRKENMEEQVSLLHMESLFGSSPSKICDAKEHLFKAKKELELINIAINNFHEYKEKNEIGLENKEEELVHENSEESIEELNVTSNMENCSNNPSHHIKESVIKMIGIGVFIGILILMVASIFRTHFGIPL